MAVTKTDPCRVIVAEDRLSAFMAFPSGIDPTVVHRKDLAWALYRAKIRITPGIERRVDKLAGILGEGKLPSEPVLIARGRPADPGQDGYFELNPELRPHRKTEDPDDPINYYEQHKIVTVAEGEVIGTIHPPVPGRPGQDVCGQPVNPTQRLREVNVGKNVGIEADGVTAVATCDGKVDYDTHSVSVSDVLEVAGDVDFSSGNIESASDVIIRGTVLDLFSVKSRRSIEVGGTVEAACLHAGGDVLIRGGLCGKEKGRVTCGGKFRAKFCDGVDIEAGGDVYLAREAINCTIQTNGSLLIPTGSLIGGRAHARNGGEIKVLGSDACVLTRIGIGMSPGTQYAIHEMGRRIKSLQAAADQVRANVQPLLDNFHRLTSEQQREATGLERDADELDARVAALLAEKERILEAKTPDGHACLLVTNRICEGVVMTVDHFKLRFEKPVKGPIKIEKRKINKVTKVVGVHQLSGSLYVFCARRMDLSDMAADYQANSR